MNLFAIAKLNEIESDCDEAQALIDRARAQFPHDGDFQYQLDIKQTELDEKRKRVMEAKSLFISPN